MSLLEQSFAQHADGHTIRLIANIMRCYFWLGAHSEFPLLFKSILMIVAQVCPSERAHNRSCDHDDINRQLALLFIFLLYRPKRTPEATYHPHDHFLFGSGHHTCDTSTVLRISCEKLLHSSSFNHLNIVQTLLCDSILGIWAM